MAVPELPPALVEQLRDLARRVGRLQQDWANPERYYHNRDELADEIDRLTRR